MCVPQSPPSEDPQLQKKMLCEIFLKIFSCWKDVMEEGLSWKDLLPNLRVATKKALADISGITLAVLV